MANENAAVTTQWVPMPAQIPGVPAGLEYLTQLDQILIKQTTELFELFTGFETNNKYKIKNSMSQTAYVAGEKSGCCAKLWCGKSRAFEMKIKDNSNREVINIKRPLRCDSCFVPCFLQSVVVTSPITGETLGFVKQKWHPCLPSYSAFWNLCSAPEFDPKILKKTLEIVKQTQILNPLYEVCDANGDAVLNIKGPFCTFSCKCGDVEFPVSSLDGQQIGKISKQWGGIKEAIIDADNFGCTFPLDLDVKVKATLLAAVFLIDFMYFEKTKKDAGDAADGVCCILDMLF